MAADCSDKHYSEIDLAGIAKIGIYSLISSADSDANAKSVANDEKYVPTIGTCAY